MLTDINVIEINKILVLCGTARMTTSEINYLDAINTESATDCDNYKISQIVILDRLKNQTCNGSVISRLFHLADANGCQLQDKAVEKPAATIMYIGGGLV